MPKLSHSSWPPATHRRMRSICNLRDRWGPACSLVHIRSVDPIVEEGQAPPLTAMADVLAPSERTLCEVNCQLVSAQAGSRSAQGRLGGQACPDIHLRSGNHAKLLEGHIPTVLVQVPPGQLPQGRLQVSSLQAREGGVLRYVLTQLLSPLPGARSRLQAVSGLQLLPGSAAGSLAWHLRKPLLAAADDANRIHVYDFTGQVPSLGQLPAGSGAPATLAPMQLLYHEFQKGVADLAWRPNGGTTLAAACTRGVCVWHLGGKGPLGAGAVRPQGGAGGSRAGGGGGSGGGAWMSWLRPPPGAGALTCLAWHPRGHLLAAASSHGAGFFIWDVATGACTPLRAGSEPVSLLSWSPCGSYLLAGSPSGSFRVWETHNWWPLKWSVSEGSSSSAARVAAAGGLAGAAWSPDSRTLLLAYAAAPQQLVSLHFTADPPSLQAQLLPLSLPEIASRANGSSRSGAAIESMAWDPRAQRLAVAVGGKHPAAGCVALYDTRCDPILSAHFIGFVRVGPMAGAEPSGAAAAQQPARGRTLPWETAAVAAGGGGRGEIEAEGAAAGAGAGGAAGGQGRGAADEEAEPARLCFQPAFGQGALLAVRRGEFIGTVPLYFSS